jgi:parvulin-like peptidyl-prolyl isomerase
MKSLLIFSIVTVMMLQDVRTDLRSIRTEQQAKAYLSRSGLKGSILDLDEIRDSSAAALRLYKAKPGEVIEVVSGDRKMTYFYKALTTRESTADRVQYIWFDNTKISKARIDSLRALIMKRIKGGESFASMAKQYSMDPKGKQGGDLGWYEPGAMVRGFSAAVQLHARGDVFIVDLPKEKWYYVVRKTHDPIKRRQIKAMYVAVPSK